MIRNDNVLQYEFLHVGGEGVKTLRQLQDQCVERMQESLPLALAGDDTGPGIKTVVRIYDTGGCVTSLSHEFNALKAEYHESAFTSHTNPISRWNARRTQTRLRNRMQECQENITQCYLENLDTLFRGDWLIARGLWDKSFRLANRDEFVELQHAAVLAKDTWLFVFEPNDLLADTNEIITSVMRG